MQLGLALAELLVDRRPQPRPRLGELLVLGRALPQHPVAIVGETAARMDLEADVQRIAAAARELAGPGEELAGVVATEPVPGSRVYLCAFEGEARSWLALDESAEPVV